MKRHKKRIGLALGSGGARGWSHIGVIKAVLDRGIEPYCVAGTSMGALVGAAFASGRIDALHQVAMDLDWKRIAYFFLELSLPRMGLIDGTRIVEFVKEYVSPVNIEELALPFAAVATDISTGDEVVLKAGNVIDAVRASIAIPGMLTPLVRDESLLVDGGLVNPLPISVARQLGADFVIAVDITRAPLPTRSRPGPRPRTEGRPYSRPVELARTNSTGKLLNRLNAKLRGLDFAALPASKRWFGKDDLPSIFDIYGNSMRIIQRQITTTRLMLEPPNLLIRPDVQDIRTTEFHRAADAVLAGYRAAQEALSTGLLEEGAA
jgi:NTE family protein